MTTYILVQPQNPPPEPQEGGPVPLTGIGFLFLAGVALAFYFLWKRRKHRI